MLLHGVPLGAIKKKDHINFTSDIQL